MRRTRTYGGSRGRPADTSSSPSWSPMSWPSAQYWPSGRSGIQSSHEILFFAKTLYEFVVSHFVSKFAVFRKQTFSKYIYLANKYVCWKMKVSHFVSKFSDFRKQTFAKYIYFANIYVCWKTKVRISLANLPKVDFREIYIFCQLIPGTSLAPSVSTCLAAFSSPPPSWG